MYELQIFSVDDGEYSFHHSVDIPFSTPQDVLGSAMNVLKMLHLTLEVPIEHVQLSNCSVMVEDKESNGVMLYSHKCPWSCFVPDLELESENPVIYDPSLPRSTRVIGDC